MLQERGKLSWDDPVSKHWTDMPAGGHFAALEEPVRLVEDIRDFFRGLR